MGARPPLEGLSVTLARHPAELQAVVPAWEELARAALEPNPFYEHWMLRPALEAFGAGRELRVVLVWAGERLAGLFPFERVARYKGLPLPAFKSWLHAHCLLCTPLVRADTARACLEALFDCLDARLVEFSYLPAGEPFHRVLAEVLAARGAQSFVSRSRSRGLLRKHRATVSGRFRRQAANSERRLKDLSQVVLQPQDDVARWIDDFLRIEASGWKGRNGSAMACTQRNRRYAAEILGAAFRRGQLIGCGLDVGGRAIARRFSFTAGEAAYAFKTAYDESYARFSPGAMLELASVRQVDADPRVQWMDSFTEDENLALERLWPDRRTVLTLVAGLGAWGRLATATLPCLRWIKQRLR
ncbi:MAG TPA: GNAT family N-acetyltransferase [Burkholderiales bacterium]|nr:GNAT family N-acetyltransferase [Burkholderiales bacterium]